MRPLHEPNIPTNPEDLAEVELVVLHRGVLDAEFSGDLLIILPVHHQLEDLNLAWR